MRIDRRSFVRSTLAAAAASALPATRLWADAAGPGAISASLAAVTGPGKPITLTASDIRDLRKSLRGALLLAQDTGYESARRIWNPAFDRHPALIARCAGAADVIQVVKFARSHELLTAVRGGGHSLSGQSSCDRGLVIDLSFLKGIRVDPVRRLAEAEPGVLLGELDRESQSFGLVTTLGTAPDTGISGLTLGGGLGRLDRRFGLACDNLLSVDVVTADGRLLHASETQNPDLFWGLRGGGGNFGIVTNLEYRLHRLGPQVLAGYRVFPYAQARSILPALIEFAQRAPDELYCAAGVFKAALQPGAAIDRYVTYEVVYSGADLHEGERLLAPLKRLGTPLLGDVAATTYLVAQGADNPNTPLPAGSGIYWKSGFLRSMPPGLFDEMLSRFEEAPPAVRGLILFQHGGAVGLIKADATAYWNRRATATLLMQAAWDEPSQSVEAMKDARAFWSTLEPFTQGYYVNTDTSDDEPRLRATYGDNYPRLMRLKNKYDPTNLFRLNANIKPSATS